MAQVNSHSRSGQEFSLSGVGTALPALPTTINWDSSALEESVPLLVKQARDGDNAAFECLIKHYQSRIYSYISRMLRDPSDAEDLTQETFVRAYQALPTFRGEASFQTWLYRIASNLTIDASRRRTRRDGNTLSLDEPREDDDSPLSRDPVDSQSRAPWEEVEAAGVKAQVWQAIAELSPKLRPVVVLYDLQGLSYEEIAQVLHCPLGTVKSRLFNARCQLRDKLKRRLPAEFLEIWVPEVESAA